LIIYICETVGYNFEESLCYTVKLESVDVVCLEPGCMMHFTNVQCLKAHVNSSHQYMTCDICGSKQLKKNIKRHLRSHEPDSSSLETFQCEFKGCSCTFSNVRLLVKSSGCTWYYEFSNWFQVNFILIRSSLCQQKSNLDKHKKVVHLKEKPFLCGFPDCGMRFAYKHVRDKHEKTVKHVFTLVSSIFLLWYPIVPKVIW